MQRPATSSGKRASAPTRRRAMAASAASRSRRTKYFCRRATRTWSRSARATGDILWDTPLSDVNHPSTSGAIVIDDKVLQGITGCGRNTSADGCYISAIDINTGKRVWRFYTIPREGEPGFDTWGKLPKEHRAGRRDVDSGLVRSGPESHLLGNRAVEAVVVSQSRDDAAGQDALLELDARAERRHRKAGVVLPACARRIVRSRRGIRARARGCRHAESVVQRRQGGRVVEARSPHRSVPRPQGDGQADDLGAHRSQDGRAELST